MKQPHSKTALLWDESFLWGLMAYKALIAEHLPFTPVRSEDIKKGVLSSYNLLFVPGGWASNKVKTLGEEGIAQIKEFVGAGGNYLGFCGGAGLATTEGIGLLDIKRKPTKERVPSFSGRIRLNLSAHPMWQGIDNNIFNVWWPSQFMPDDTSAMLARYDRAMPDAFSSDLNVADTEQYGSWADKEKLYGINLDPSRLFNDPAVVEGTYGKGKVMLSLVHFDTPDDGNGAAVLRNLWNYLGGATGRWDDGTMGHRDMEDRGPRNTAALLEELEAAAEDLISFGQRNFLWFMRNSMLMQWRRGVRGLEYCNLRVMLKEIVKAANNSPEQSALIHDKAERIKGLLMPFIEKAKNLLILEKEELLNSHITYEACNNQEMRETRTELFGNAKSHGGLFKTLIGEIDSLLYLLL